MSRLLCFQVCVPTDTNTALFEKYSSYIMTRSSPLTRPGLDIHRMMAELIGKLIVEPIYLYDSGQAFIDL